MNRKALIGSIRATGRGIIEDALAGKVDARKWGRQFASVLENTAREVRAHVGRSNRAPMPLFEQPAKPENRVCLDFECRAAFRGYPNEKCPACGGLARAAR